MPIFHAVHVSNVTGGHPEVAFDLSTDLETRPSTILLTPGGILVALRFFNKNIQRIVFLNKITILTHCGQVAPINVVNIGTSNDLPVGQRHNLNQC